MPTTQLTLNRKSTTERSEKDHKLFEIIEICLSGENLGTTQINLKDLLVHIQTQVSNVYNVHEPSGVEKINRYVSFYELKWWSTYFVYCRELHSHDTTTTRTTYSNTSTTTRKHVQLADLQHLLHSQSFAEPTILLRHGCVVLNLYPIHAIIVSSVGVIVCIDVLRSSVLMNVVSCLVVMLMCVVVVMSNNNVIVTLFTLVPSGEQQADCVCDWEITHDGCARWRDYGRWVLLLCAVVWWWSWVELSLLFQNVVTHISVVSFLFAHRSVMSVHVWLLY